jgi:hypothetical protein
MSKFLPNLLLRISKALVNSKIQFLIQKFSFLTFGPADLVAQPARWPHCPCRPKPTPIGPPSPCVGRVFTGIRFPFWFAPSELATSPSSLCQPDPDCQLRPSHPAARARPRRHRFPATPRRPALRLGWCRAVTTPSSFSLP